MPAKLMYPPWEELTLDDKGKMLSEIITRTATDIGFRERCLASDTSAIAAVAEYCEGLPRDFSITFIDSHDQDEKSNRVIVRLPSWKGDGQTIQPIPPQGYVVCTYALWLTSKSKKKHRPAGRKKKLKAQSAR